jgi:hypothetical protein
MSDDNGQSGGGDSGGGGYDSSCGGHDGSHHHDSSHNDLSHNTEDYHSTGSNSFNYGADEISSNTPRRKNKYKINIKSKNAEVKKNDCCCTLI